MACCSPVSGRSTLHVNSRIFAPEWSAAKQCIPHLNGIENASESDSSSTLSALQHRRTHPCNLTIQLLGQSMLQHDMHEYERGRNMMEEMKALLDGDVVFTELETAIITHDFDEHACIHGQRLKQPIFLHVAPPSVIDCLIEMNCNVIETANNHSGDLGDTGICCLLNEIEKRSDRISSAGIGRDIAEAADVQIVTVQKTFNCDSIYRVGHIAFASKIPQGTEATVKKMGVHSLPMDDLEAGLLNAEACLNIWSALSRAKGVCDVVIAYHHNHYWSESMVNRPETVMGWRVEFARRCIDFGASIYVSHGTPRLQAIEVYKNGLIFYSLGNFIFQTQTPIGFYGPEVWQSVVVEIQFHHDPHEHYAHASRNVDFVAMEAASVEKTVAFYYKNTSRFTGFSVKLTPLILNDNGVFETRGLPERARFDVAIQILQQLQVASAEYGTILQIDQSDPERPVGWISVGGSRNVKLDAPLLMDKSLDSSTQRFSTFIPDFFTSVTPSPDMLDLLTDQFGRVAYNYDYFTSILSHASGTQPASA